MGTYEITTESGTYRIETEDGAPTSDNNQDESFLDMLGKNSLDAVAGIGAAANSALFGLPSFAEAGAETLLNNVFGGNKGFWDTVAANKEALSGHPTAEVVGSLLSPVNALKPVQAAFKMGGLAGVGARAATNAAIAGGLRASQATNPEELASGAIEGAATGALLSPAFDVAMLGAGKLADAGKAAFRKGMGLTARDYQAAVRSEGLSSLGEGKQAIQAELDKLRGEGGLSYGDLFKPTETTLTRAAQKAGAIKSGLDEEVSNIIANRSAELGPGQTPDLEFIDSILSKLSGEDRIAAYNRIADMFSAAFPEGSTTLAGLQGEKLGLNKTFKSDPESIIAKQIWRRAVRRGIEQAAPEVVPLNRESGLLSELISGFKKDLPAAQAADPLATIGQGLYTTSGAGLGGANALAELADSPSAGKISALLGALNFLKPAERVAGAAAADIGGLLSSVFGSQLPRSAVDEFSAIDRPKKKLTTEEPPMEKKESGKALDLNKLVDAVIQQESGGNHRAVSDVGAQGLMQIMPATGKELAAKYGVGDYEPFNAEQNKKLGTLYLKELLDRYNGDPELALTAYHTGMGTVSRLLAEKNGSKLSDILDDLGPVGKVYAKQVLGRMV